MSIGAFEHFGADRYDDFFKKTYQALPADGGKMLLHTIVKPSDEEFTGRGLKLTMRLLRYVKFIMDEIFPGGELPKVALVEEHAAKVGFEVSRVQSTSTALREDVGHLGQRRSRRARTRPSRSSPKRSTSAT